MKIVETRRSSAIAGDANHGGAHETGHEAKGVEEADSLVGGVTLTSEIT